DPALLALGYEIRADLHRAAGRADDAHRDLERALDLARGVDLPLEGVIYRNLAVLERKRGRDDAAAAAAGASLRIFHRVGDRHMEARARLEVGALALRGGDVAGARAAFEDALKTFRAV